MSPLRNEDFLQVDETATFGILGTNGEMLYGKNRDYYLYSMMSPARITRGMSVRKIPPDRIILAYYYWDYNYQKIEPIENYRTFLRAFYAVGVRITAFLDFSVWYTESKEKNLANIKKAFDYADVAREEGFKLIWNNNLCNRYFDVVSALLPEQISVYIVDGNHKEDKTPIANATERDIFARMEERYHPKKILFITGSTKNQFHRNYIIRHPGMVYLPSEIMFASLKRELYYKPAKKPCGKYKKDPAI